MNSSQRVEQLLLFLQDDPTDSFLQYALALEYQKLGKVSKAIKTIEYLLMNNSAYLGAYYQLGKLYEAENDLQKAVSIYKTGKTLAQKQDNRKTLNELNEALQNLEEN